MIIVEEYQDFTNVFIHKSAKVLHEDITADEHVIGFK